MICVICNFFIGASADNQVLSVSPAISHAYKEPINSEIVHKGIDVSWKMQTIDGPLGQTCVASCPLKQAL